MRILIVLAIMSLVAPANAEGFVIADDIQTKSTPSGDIHSLFVRCPNNMKVISGGYEVTADPKIFALYSNNPGAQGYGWNVTVRNVGEYEVAITLRVWAFCTDQPVEPASKSPKQ